MLRTCHLSFPGRSGPLAFDYFEASAGHISAILNGTTYPEIPDIGEVRTIVDIGANVGAASVALAARYPSAVIHAFEPGPAPRELLTRNTSTLSRVHVHAHGIHDHDAVVKLFRSRWDPMSASIATSSENTLEFDEIVLRSAGAVAAKLALTAIDVLKIDTEGCEVPILRAWQDRLVNVRLLYIEYHSDDDRRAIDALLAPTHLLARADTRHPHRGEVTYVARNTVFSQKAESLAIRG